MFWLRQSTSITERLGPFLDEDDGKTPETGGSIAQADIRLSKNGGDFAQSNDTGGGTHDENGWWYITLDATDTGTLGRLRVAIHKSGALPVWQDYMVITQNAWDSLYGSDKLQVHVDEMTNGIITAAAMAASALDSDVMTAALANKIADHIIRRSFQNACDSSDGDTKSFRSALGAIASLVNKVWPNGANLEIFEDDDVTVLGTRTPNTSGTADPIIGIDTV